jgi:sugar transferase (PEP-CTERM/EpsH1 system associated)
MKDILFLPHRIPYPPNKGDKIRSFHILERLARNYRVHIATFVDHPGDWRYCDEVRKYVDEAFFCPLSPGLAKLRSLWGLVEGTALSLPYYRDRRMTAWVDDVVKRRKIDGVFVFSSVMAQYGRAKTGKSRVVDFVDVDSEKWRSYASRRHWPMSWVYAREGEQLLRFERDVARDSRHALFVSINEATLFNRLAPESQGRILTMQNGVDTEFFSPSGDFENPFPDGIEPLVFTGAMDYWPNVDAMLWLSREVLPAVVRLRPRMRLFIVGSNPVPEIAALGSNPHIEVTGTVPDVRPYLAHARAVVAPLRIARGVQNKVLEAMAMAKPLVVSPEALGGIAEAEGLELVVASSVAEWIEALSGIEALPSNASQNRRFIESKYDWEENLRILDGLW